THRVRAGARATWWSRGLQPRGHAGHRPAVAMRFPVPPALVRILATPVVEALSRSWRYTTHGAERWTAITERGEPYIFLLWHEAIIPLLWHLRDQGIAIIVSQGREGRYVGDYASRLGYRILSGSSTKGGARALLGAG